MKEDLLNLLDDLEKYAAKGKFNTGTNLQVYISNVNFDSTYTYLTSPTGNISMYRLYTINSIITHDPAVYQYTIDFIQSMKKYSTLISESAEMQRIQFFNKQRELIRSLDHI